VTAPVYVDTVSAQLSGLAEVRHLKGLPAAERAALISGAEVILAASWRREFGPGEARNSRAGLVQLLWAGADGMPFDQMPRDAVIASNVGAYAEPMAEHAVAMTLALMKRLPQNHLRLAAGIWDEGRSAPGSMPSTPAAAPLRRSISPGRSTISATSCRKRTRSCSAFR
jgi:phosphoglycerate dehydrogenase-like enzyme